jgi:hypothetical protein
MASVAVVLFGVVLAGAGGFGLWWGYSRREPHELITETPTTEVRRLSEAGLVELKGEVAGPAAGADAFASPIGGDEALVAAWTVEEWDERGDHSRWRTLASGVRSVPFELDDGTGRVAVEVGDHADGGLFTAGVDPAASDGVSFGDVLVEFDAYDTVRKVGAEEAAPASIREFVAGERTVGPQSGSITNVIDVGNAHGDRRYYEETFGPGERLYVLGRTYPRDPDPAYPLRPGELVVTAPRDDDDGMLIVANEREQELVRQTRYHLLGLALGGAGLVAGLVLVGVGL